MATNKKASTPAIPPTANTTIKPIALPNSNITLFDVNNPIKPVFTDSSSSREEHEKLLDFLANLGLSGLYAAWSSPPKSVSAIISLVKQTNIQIRERCKLYNIPYDSNDSAQSGRRLRTFSID